MNTFTRVMVITVLVLSLIYVGVGAVLFATREQWRTKNNDDQAAWQQERLQLQSDKTALEQDAARLSTELATKNTDLELLQERYVKLETENKSLTARNQELGNTYRNLSDDMAKLSERNESIVKMALSFQSDLAKTEEQLRTMTRQRDDLDEDRQRLEGELARLTTQFEETKKLLAKADKERERLTEIVAALKERGFAIGEIIGALEVEPVSGNVVSVDPELGIVLVNVGAREKVKKGYEFTVSRGGDYVTKIIIYEVSEDAAAGRMLKGYSRRPVKIGDRVDTRLF